MPINDQFRSGELASELGATTRPFRETDERIADEIG